MAEAVAAVSAKPTLNRLIANVTKAVLVELPRAAYWTAEIGHWLDFTTKVAEGLFQHRRLLFHDTGGLPYLTAISAMTVTEIACRALFL